MRKIILIFIALVFAFLNIKSQFYVGAETSFDRYKLTEIEASYLTPGLSANAKIGYYFKNQLGIISGFSTQNRFFDLDNDRIFSKYLQIPLLFSQNIKFREVPFGISISGGYLLTVPYATKTLQNNSYDIGYIHGVNFYYVFNSYVNEKTQFYCGLQASYDFINENDIKFHSSGIILGMRVFL